MRLPPALPNDPRGSGALSPDPDWELWRDVWPAWLTRLLPQCRWMTISPRPHGINTNASPPFAPPPPPAQHYTALHTAHY